MGKSFSFTAHGKTCFLFRSPNASPVSFFLGRKQMMKGRYPPPFSFSRKKKRKGGRSPRQEPPFGRLRGETRLRPQGRCKTKKRLWCRPMGPMLLSKHFNARQLHCRFGARRTPRRFPDRCRSLGAKEKRCAIGAGSFALRLWGRIQERGPRPPSWSFQGDGFLKGRGKSKSPYP